MKAVCTGYKQWEHFCTFDSWPLNSLVKEPNKMSKIWILTKFAQSPNCDGSFAGYRLIQLQRMISSIDVNEKRKKELLTSNSFYGWLWLNEKTSVMSNVPLFCWRNVFQWFAPNVYMRQLALFFNLALPLARLLMEDGNRLQFERSWKHFY